MAKQHKALTAAQAIAIANRLIRQMAEMVETIGNLACENDRLAKENRILHDVVETSNRTDLLQQFRALEQQIASLKGRG